MNVPDAVDESVEWSLSVSNRAAAQSSSEDEDEDDDDDDDENDVFGASFM